MRFRSFLATVNTCTQAPSRRRARPGARPEALPEVRSVPVLGTGIFPVLFVWGSAFRVSASVRRLKRTVRNREPDRTAVRAVSRRFVLFHSFRQPGGLDAGVAKALSEHADRALFGGEIGREFGGRGPYGFKKRVAGRHVGRATGFDPFQFLGGNVRGEVRLAEERTFEECFEAFEFVEELDLGRGRRGVDRAGKERDGSRNPFPTPDGVRRIGAFRGIHGIPRVSSATFRTASTCVHSCITSRRSVMRRVSASVRIQAGSTGALRVLRRPKSRNAPVGM